MHNGFIAVHRKLLNNPIFDNPHLFKMWMWCLLKATHKEHEQLIGLEMIKLKKGQFITGRLAGSKELKVSENMWYRHLKMLEKLEMIVVNSNNKYSLVTVVKWELYQVDKSKLDNKQTTNRQQIDTNNNVNNVNKEYSSYFEEVWNLYPSKKGKAKVSDTQKKEIYKLGDEFIRCIDRYKKDIQKEKLSGFKDKQYQNGSTFFNSGYVDYLDSNYNNEVVETKYNLGSERFI